jgi:hypothetical protein
MPRRAGSEAGFTVVEMLVVTLISGVVFMALISMVDASHRVSTRVTQRIDSSQHGRVAMEQITQSLRSQVCIKDEPVLSPLAAGDANALTFYAARPTTVAGQAKPTDFAPQKREVRYDPATRRITETVTAGTGSYPHMTFTGAPFSRRVLATDIVPAAAGAPIFTYWALEEDGSVSTSPMTLPLDLDEREAVVRVDIAFAALPAEGPKKNRGTETNFESSVTVRLPTRTDSDNPGSGPACML